MNSGGFGFVCEFDLSLNSLLNIIMEIGRC